MVSTEAALIYTMVIISAADNDMTDSELSAIGGIVHLLPVFEEYDPNMLLETARSCADILSEDDGMVTVLGVIKESIPVALRETAYALAIEIALADGNASPEELRLLELIRFNLNIDRLVAVGIERGAQARFASI
jgi:tellurite resistance protein